MRFFAIFLVVIISGCAGSFAEMQNRGDAVEVDINGSVIRVVDLGHKVEMVRKGYLYIGPTQDWADYVIAGEKATGCKITNLVNKVGTQNFVWVEATKDCQ